MIDDSFPILQTTELTWGRKWIHTDTQHENWEYICLFLRDKRGLLLPFLSFQYLTMSHEMSNLKHDLSNADQVSALRFQSKFKDI